MTSDATLQSSQPRTGGKTRAENTPFAHQAWAKSAGFRFDFKTTQIPSAVCEGNCSDPRMKRKRTDTRVSLSNLFKADVLTNAPYRRTLLSNTVLFSKSPQDQLSFIGIQTQHWKHATSHQSWVSSPQWLLLERLMKKRNFFFNPNPSSSVCLFFFLLETVLFHFGKTEIIHSSCSDVPFILFSTLQK